MSKKSPLSSTSTSIIRSQRVMLETIHFCIEMINDDFRVIANIMDEISRSTPGPIEPEGKKFRLFSCAWSIVDRVDQIRLILHGQRKHWNINLGENWNKMVNTARDCRNEIDHLGSNSQKIQTKKTYLPPLGVISCTWLLKEEILYNESKSEISINAQHATIVFSGSIQHQINIPGKEAFLEDGIPVGISKICLFTNNGKLELEDCVNFANWLRNQLETAIQDNTLQNEDTT